MKTTPQRPQEATDHPTDLSKEPPVRLCCLQRHYGAICPDGKVMCCLCFDRFEIKDLSVTEDGTPEDVCRACNEMERAHPNYHGPVARNPASGV